MQAGLEEVWVGRPAFDDPHRYSSVHETIRPRPVDAKLVALCFECMEVPRREARIVGHDKTTGNAIYDKPQRCDGCEHKHNRRLRGARAAKGGY